MWDIKTFSDINPSNLAILDLLDPPPEVLVVGCGASMKPIGQELQQHLIARGIAMEVLDTVSSGNAQILFRATLRCPAWHTDSESAICGAASMFASVVHVHDQ